MYFVRIVGYRPRATLTFKIRPKRFNALYIKEDNLYLFPLVVKSVMIYWRE
jgi:hypothetical protein